MNSLIASFLNIKLLGFYLLIFSLIVGLRIVRKAKKKKIIINSIWFSEDGSISDEAQVNLTQLIQQIKQSTYNDRYEVFLWTDKKQLQKSTYKKLSKQGIVIKDYRDVKPLDAASKQMNQWIGELIQLGDESNKYFYCLASDLLRFYLLFKEFPEHYKNSVTIYIDCNDIEILAIPHPDAFKMLESVAFNFLYIQYIEILQKLIGYEAGSQPYFSNDVIIVANNRFDARLNKLFKIYYHNLNNINVHLNGWIAKLKETKLAINQQDRSLAVSIVFAISQTKMIMRRKEGNDTTFLLDWSQNPLEIESIDWIQSASAFLQVDRDYEKGLTWGKTSGNPVEAELSHPYRQGWYDLFATRYHLITATLDDKIAEANI